MNISFFHDYLKACLHFSEDRYPPPSDSNPAAVGLVVGIAGGVFGFLFIIGCIGICCFRKYRAGRMSSKGFVFHHPEKPKSDTSNSVSVGYTNESMSGSPMSKKKLLSRSDSDEKFESGNQRPRPRTLNLRGANRTNMANGNTRSNLSPVTPPAPPPPPVEKLRPVKGNVGNKSGNKSDDSDKSNERGVDVDSNPRGAMLGALRNNAKFRNSFKSTEEEAEERAKRISSSSSFEKFGQAPSPPSSDESIARPSLPAVPKSPKSKTSKHARINRNPRPTSLSSDEIAQIEKGHQEDGNDPNIKVLHDNGSSSSASEVVPIKVSAGEKKKPNTTHSLKPDRKKIGKSKKQQKESVSSAIDPPPKPSPRAGRERIQSLDSQLDDRPRHAHDRVMEKDYDEPFEKMGSGRYSKGKGRKSPRPGKSSGNKISVFLR